MGKSEILFDIERHAEEIVRLCREAGHRPDWATLANVIAEEAAEERAGLEKPLTAIEGGLSNH